MTISYGVDIPEDFSPNDIKKYDLTAGRYDLIVARMVPENNIETDIVAKIKSKDNIPLVIFGNRNNYRDVLSNKYSNFENIIFQDGNFDKRIMDNIKLNYVINAY